MEEKNYRQVYFCTRDSLLVSTDVPREHELYVMAAALYHIGLKSIDNVLKQYCLHRLS